MKITQKHAGPARNQRCVRGGFTLVEVVAAMTVMGILMMGMGSTMIIASRAIPDGKSPMAIATESRNVMDRLTDDLLYTTSITEKEATAITFAVADRGHGAAGPETIRYAWSGTPSDPLTLEYNGAPAVNLIDDIQDFALSYAVKADQAGEAPLVEGAARGEGLQGPRRVELALGVFSTHSWTSGASAPWRAGVT